MTGCCHLAFSVRNSRSVGHVKPEKKRFRKALSHRLYGVYVKVEACRKATLLGTPSTDATKQRTVSSWLDFFAFSCIVSLVPRDTCPPTTLF